MRHASKAASSAPAQRVFDLPVAVYVLDADFSKQSTVGGHVFSCVNREAVARLRRLRVNAVDERREAARCTRYRTCPLHFAWRLRMRRFLSRRCAGCWPGKLHGRSRRRVRVNACDVHFVLKKEERGGHLSPLPACLRTQVTLWRSDCRWAHSQQPSHATSTRCAHTSRSLLDPRGKSFNRKQVRNIPSCVTWHIHTPLFAPIYHMSAQLAASSLTPLVRIFCSIKASF